MFLKPSEAEFKDNGPACLAEEILKWKQIWASTAEAAIFNRDQHHYRDLVRTSITCLPWGQHTEAIQLRSQEAQPYPRWQQNLVMPCAIHVTLVFRVWKMQDWGHPGEHLGRGTQWPESLQTDPATFLYEDASKASATMKILGPWRCQDCGMFTRERYSCGDGLSWWEKPCVLQVAEPDG